MYMVYRTHRWYFVGKYISIRLDYHCLREVIARLNKSGSGLLCSHLQLIRQGPQSKLSRLVGEDWQQSQPVPSYPL